MTDKLVKIVTKNLFYDHYAGLKRCITFLTQHKSQNTSARHKSNANYGNLVYD